MSFPNKTSPWTERDRLIIAHVERYHITTIAVLQAAVVVGATANAMMKITTKLCASGLLRKFTLIHPTRYFMLGEAAKLFVGHKVSNVVPGPQTLPTDFALLQYALLGQAPRQRLFSNEVQSFCPWLPKPLSTTPHCLNPLTRQLELVRVDLGGTADHVARKCAANIQERLSTPEFTTAVGQGRFRLVVITATAEKSAAIRKSLLNHEWPDGLAIHLSVIPTLLPLLSRLRHA